MTSHKYSFVTLLILLLVSGSSVWAQSDRGAITGRVTDPAGAVVPQAKVTVTNLETNESRDAVTSDEGNFTVPQLPAAMYKITVEAPGFKTATLDNIKVAVQITRTADIKLEVGAVGEVVNVSGEAAPVLQTDTPVQQLNVSERQVRELPLLVAAESGGRSPLSFIFLDSSIVSNDTPGGTGTTSGSTGTNATNFRINGGQGLGADILIDGAQTRRGENGTFFSEVAPGPNAFQEFTVSTSSYSAEFGNSTGGIVNFTIKTGGNDFHGEAYLFHINDALNANIDRNRILNANNSACRLQNVGCLDKPLDRQFDYGFSVGGPVYLPRFGEGGKMLWSGKNKTFFFFNYGAYRTFQSESVELTVPTARMRNGDFGELLTDPYVLQFFGPGGVQIYDPSQLPFQPDPDKPNFSPNGRTAIPGNRLDQYLGGSRISTIGRNFLNLFPLPNQTGPNGSAVFRNFRANTTATSRTDYYVTKITHNLTDRQSLNFSYTFRKLPSVKGGFPRFAEPFVAQGVWDQLFKSYYARLQHDWTLTGNMINHFNAGFSRSDVSNRNFSSGIAKASDLGLSPTATQDRGLPLIGFPGYGDPVNSTDPRAYQAGGSTFFDNRVRDNSVHLSDVFTFISGRHTMKFGGELRLQQLNNAAHFDIGGNFNFRSNQTANTNDFNQGWPIASLITGRPEFSFNSNQTIDPGHRFLSYAAFYQDDFKITSKLTLNLGFRYDFGRPREEARGKFRGFDPSVPNPAAGGRLGAFVSAGPGPLQAENFGLVNPDRTNFGPRFGFAYSVNEKTVVRGGYGIYYAPVIYNDFGNAGALGYSPGAVNINGGLDAFITLENYPHIPVADPTSQVVGDLNRTDLDYFTKDFKTGRTVQYTLDIQRQLPWNLAIQVGYVGSKGTRLRSNFDQVNKLPLNALKLGLPLLSKRLADVTASDRAYATSVGFTLPASPDAVYPGFNNQGGDFASSVSQALRPFPQYGIITNRLESEGQSFYNAGKVDLTRRFAQGIQAGLSYTFAKLITDAAEDVFGNSPLNGVVQNPYDRRSLRTISASIPPHSLVFNYIIEAPFGKGRRFLNRGGFIDRLVGGFQFTGIHRYRSGPALLPFIAGGQREFLQRIGFLGNLRPNVTGQSFFTGNPSGGIDYRYLNPAAFSRPLDYRNAPGPIGSPEYAAYYADPNRFFGNSAPTYGSLRAPPFFTEDVSVMKKTRVTETTYFEIRMEIFNLFNRGRYGLPNLNVDDGNFGITSRNADIFQPRRIQVGGRFVF